MLDIIFFGTYDLTKPRQRILIEAATRAGFVYRQIHANIWSFKDKSKVDLLTLLAIIFFGVLSSIQLLVRYLLSPKHKYVFIGYPGFIDILLIWPLAKLRKASIVYDSYLPLYEILIEERKIFEAFSLAAIIIFRLEKFIYKIADVILTDTLTHAKYINTHFDTPANKIKVIYVGAESFFERSENNSSNKLKLLFYGQVAPLHGFGCIAKAIKILEKDHNIFFTLIGGSSKDVEIQKLLESKPANVEYKEWVNYENLVEELAKADVCLGIFGATEKADRVIANKVFQALAAGTIVITGKTRAIAELEMQVPAAQLILVPLDDERQLAQSIRKLAAEKEKNASLKYAARSFYPIIVDQLKLALL